MGRWTNDAPPSGYSTVDLRGYTSGQYLAPHSTMVEADYRHMVYKEKVGAAVFGGVLFGIGVGFFFLQTSPLLFVGSILAGLGIGLVITAIISSKSNINT